MNKELQIDKAVEEGNIKEVGKLISDGICPSLYALQMSMINGHYNTVHYVLAYCPNKLRNDTNIKNLHYNYKKKEWNKCIPKEHQY
jgi:hypothetical protein